jgi:hypothetical protein
MEHQHWGDAKLTSIPRHFDGQQSDASNMASDALAIHLEFKILLFFQPV